ncbi:MAG: hypothetical protein CVU64_14170 [Deltaproteobacteria bacterium HGW-Deltaproteobacteria-21]|nr:MAG: hypothetical protein CVU64_14170 [Deltaproteobacteria bacterium HGW-Deltaproteobacteria-21]
MHCSVNLLPDAESKGLFPDILVNRRLTLLSGFDPPDFARAAEISKGDGYLGLREMEVTIRIIEILGRKLPESFGRFSDRLGNAFIRRHL